MEEKFAILVRFGRHPCIGMAYSDSPMATRHWKVWRWQDCAAHMSTCGTMYSSFIPPYCTCRPAGKDYTTQRLLLGTHTSDGEPNYLQFAEVHLPTDLSDTDKKYDEERGGILLMHDALTVWNASMSCLKHSLIEGGGYGGGESKIKIVQKIPHDGEVNRYAMHEMTRRDGRWTHDGCIA